MTFLEEVPLREKEPGTTRHRDSNEVLGQLGDIDGRAAGRPAAEGEPVQVRSGEIDKAAGRGRAPKRRQAASSDDAQMLLHGAEVAAGERSRSGSGVRLRASVLIADLRGFTRLSARLEPAEVVGLLQDFFTATTDVAVANRAGIDRLIGDAVMLVYGLPRPRRDDPVRAVRTALDLQRAFLALRNRWLKEGRAVGREVGLSIGVASGDVIVASLGAGARPESATIGEAVKAATRLCAGARLAESLLDEATYSAVCGPLDREVVFTSREVSSKSRDSLSGYRVQSRRAGLHVVPPRPVIDPVCQAQLTPSGAVRRQFRGQTHYFCSQTCARRYAEGERNVTGDQ
jgi:class 3 adenylate cyclase/YHS domain-containing protein